MPKNPYKNNFKNVMLQCVMFVSHPNEYIFKNISSVFGNICFNRQLKYLDTYSKCIQKYPRSISNVSSVKYF